MRRLLAAAAAVVALVGCSAQAPAGVATPEPSVAAATPTPSSTIDPTQPMTWPVPTDALTPGLVVEGCTYPRPDSERYVSTQTKRAAAKRYNYTGPSGLEYLEYDHRIPFSLCGANTVANIWPEPVDGVKQTAFVYNRKDQLEAFAARQVRTHRWTLKYGQEVFLGDWRVAWCKYIHSAGVDCG